MHHRLQRYHEYMGNWRLHRDGHKGASAGNRPFGHDYIAVNANLLPTRAVAFAHHMGMESDFYDWTRNH